MHATLIVYLRILRKHPNYLGAILQACTQVNLAPIMAMSCPGLAIPLTIKASIFKSQLPINLKDDSTSIANLSSE
jgi:hypothetical protein